MSGVTFSESSNWLRARYYMYTNEYPLQGWYNEAERTIDPTTTF